MSLVDTPGCRREPFCLRAQLLRRIHSRPAVGQFGRRLNDRGARQVQHRPRGPHCACGQRARAAPSPRAPAVRTAPAWDRDDHRAAGEPPPTAPVVVARQATRCAGRAQDDRRPPRSRPPRAPSGAPRLSPLPARQTPAHPATVSNLRGPGNAPSASTTTLRSPGAHGGSGTTDGPPAADAGIATRASATISPIARPPNFTACLGRPIRALMPPINRPPCKGRSFHATGSQRQCTQEPSQPVAGPRDRGDDSGDPFRRLRPLCVTQPELRQRRVLVTFHQQQIVVAGHRATYLQKQCRRPPLKLLLRPAQRDRSPRPK